MARHRVFICHMSPDKQPLLTPVLRALLDDERFDVWIDNPGACHPSIVPDLQGGIPAGVRWESHIREIMQDSACILACVSSTYVKRQPGWFKRLTGKAPKFDQFEEEIVIADGTARLVCCRLDAIDPADFPPKFPREQVTDLSDPATFDDRMKTLRDGLADVARRTRLSATERKEEEQREARRAAVLLTLLAGRERQEAQIRDALRQANDRNGLVYPLIVYGPRNELPIGFIDRLTHLSAKFFKTGAWHELTVGMPGSGAEFEADYRARLEGKLDDYVKAPVTGLAAKLAAIGRPVCIVHQMDGQHWHAGDGDRVRNWLRVWKALAREAPMAKLVPLLCVTLPPAVPGWHVVDDEDAMPPDLSGAKGLGNVALRTALRAIFAEAAAGDLPPFGLTPVLPPLYQSEADEWARAQREGISRRLRLDDLTVERRIETLFASRVTTEGYNPAEHGLNLQFFRDAFVGVGQEKGG